MNEELYRPHDRSLRLGSGLEPIDVEVRDPTIVLSVRLSGPFARLLHAEARARGIRMSEVLRPAVEEHLSGVRTAGSAVNVEWHPERTT